MNNDEILARFGISSKLAYGLLAQSILVIFAAIISIWGIFEANRAFTLSYITNIISLLVCISLLVYSFYGFNAKKNQEAFFVAAIILYIVLILFGLLANTLDLKNPVSMLTVITLVCIIFFLREYRINYKVANFAMLIALISGFIVLVFNVMGGMPWFIALKYIIIPVTIALTYFERSQRGKYDFKI
ncbi:hypothetical protein TL18_00545 [Methanobrevibacter sp. YE315]|uniref:hypothetical protein n=1 Tax=Methanobrevibacter sp. YE315 TaxID=1609968 RepID=UPI000764E2F1|nr:hypothetical protein [Methanobrevibacter sp. YE315]AMD16655.1 hypothetical protein TL18_00545 [Methanobrevibacter sp. YE315]